MGCSLDAQRDKLRKYAAYEDMIVAREYSDEGFSGKSIQGRQDFQWMLNDIQDGKDKEGSYLLLCCKILPNFGQNQQSEKETRFYLDTQQRIWYGNHA